MSGLPGGVSVSSRVECFSVVAWRGLAASVGAVVVAALLVATPALADPATPGSPGRPVRSVPVSPAKPKPPTVPQSQRDPWSPSGVSWPTPGAAIVDLGAARGSRVRAAGLPVWAGLAAGSPAVGGPSRLRVEVLDKAVSERAGVAGVLLRLSWVDAPTAAGAASVEVDYSGFRGLFGGDWAARLGLVRLPGCVVSTPELGACQRAEPLGSRNNPTTGRLVAEVPVAAQVVSSADRRLALGLGEAVPASGGTVLAAMSTTTSSGGQFRADT